MFYKEHLVNTAAIYFTSRMCRSVSSPKAGSNGLALVQPAIASPRKLLPRTLGFSRRRSLIGPGPAVTEVLWCSGWGEEAVPAEFSPRGGRETSAPCEPGLLRFLYPAPWQSQVKANGRAPGSGRGRVREGRVGELREGIKAEAFKLKVFSLYLKKVDIPDIKPKARKTLLSPTLAN